MFEAPSPARRSLSILHILLACVRGVWMGASMTGLWTRTVRVYSSCCLRSTDHHHPLWALRAPRLLRRGGGPPAPPESQSADQAPRRCRSRAPHPPRIPDESIVGSRPSSVRAAAQPAAGSVTSPSIHRRRAGGALVVGDLNDSAGARQVSPGGPLVRRFTWVFLTYSRL